MTPWIVAHQAPLSMEFSRKNTGVGYHFLYPLGRLKFTGLKTSNEFSEWILTSLRVVICRRLVCTGLVLCFPGLTKATLQTQEPQKETQDSNTTTHTQNPKLPPQSLQAKQTQRLLWKPRNYLRSAFSVPQTEASAVLRKRPEAQAKT